MKNNNKLMSVLVGAAIACSPSLAFADEAKTEIGYSKGSLGYEALISGQTLQAISQLQDAKAELGDDPARLINLGSAYARVGEYEQARRMFKAAANGPDSFDLVLADGRVMNSRDAARLAMSSLDSRYAGR